MPRTRRVKFHAVLLDGSDFFRNELTAVVCEGGVVTLVRVAGHEKYASDYFGSYTVLPQ